MLRHSWGHQGKRRLNSLVCLVKVAMVRKAELEGSSSAMRMYSPSKRCVKTSKILPPTSRVSSDYGGISIMQIRRLDHHSTYLWVDSLDDCSEPDQAFVNVRFHGTGDRSTNREYNERR